MDKIQFIRQWAGAILAFLAVFISYGHANAPNEIAFAMPMCLFFVCAAAYSSEKQIQELRHQIRKMQEASGSDDSKP